MLRNHKSHAAAARVEVRATLHDVAARARVSIATVSRALNGLPVSPDYRRRVHKAAAELGYVANEAARALRRERSHTMGLLFFDLRTTLGLELLDSLGESIEDAGYSLLISTARGDARRFELLMHRFLERRVDALFCVHARGDSETLARYQAVGIPVITLIAGAGAFDELPRVGPSIAQASDSLAQHLAEHGHQHVALVRQKVERGLVTTIGRALEARGVRVDEIATSDVGGMSEVLDSLLARGTLRTRPTRPTRPTTVIAPTVHAHALLGACEAARIGVPDELSIVSFGRPGADAHLEQSARAISCLTIDPHRVGRAAGGAMLGWLSGARPADRLLIECGSFVARATTGQAMTEND